jgi:hypothetical protein
MNAKRMLILAALAVMLFSTGCFSLFVRKGSSMAFGESGSVSVIKLVAKDPMSYENVIIGEFITDMGGKVPPRIAPELRQDIITQVGKNDKLHYHVFLAEDAPKVPSALVITGEILDYEEGNRTARATTVGGDAFMIVRYTVKDASTGETLAIINSRGFLTGGLTGGSIDDTVSTANIGIMRYLKGELKE